MINILNFRLDYRFLIFFDVETTNKYFILENDCVIENARLISFDEYNKYKQKNEKAEEIRYKIGSYMITKMVSIMDEIGNGVCIVIDDNLCTTEMDIYKTNDYSIDVIYADDTEELIDNFWLTIDNYILKYGEIRVFAHNIGFDIKQVDFFNRIIDFEGGSIQKPGKSKKIQSCCLDKPFFIKIRYDNDNTITFEDSYNFFSTSLKKLGSDIGIPKEEFKFDGKDLIIDDICVKYCINDTFIIKTAICNFKNFLEDNELGIMGITTSSTALNVFRTSFLEKPINNSYKKAIAPYTKDRIIAIERACYHGGRNECYKIGNFENIYYYDITSMYPYVMRKYKYPIEFIGIISCNGFINKNYIEELIKNSKSYYIFSCKIITNSPHIPFKSDRLLFIKGEVTTYLHMGEFLYYWSKNEVVEIYDILVYKSYDIFTGYINFFEKMKNDNNDNPTYRNSSKLLQNGLYGKLAEHLRESKFFDNITPEIGTSYILDEKNAIIGRRDDFGYFGIMNLENKQKNAKTAFPAIAGAVTSYARVELLKMMEILGTSNILYNDTDSLMSMVKMPEKYIHPCAYGLWKNESLKIHGKETINVIIKGCKNYILHNGKEVLEIKSKGIKKDSIEILDDVYSTNKWWTVKTSKVKKETIFTLKHTIIMHEIKKNTLEYKKGKIIGDGTEKIKLLLNGKEKIFKYNVRDIKPYRKCDNVLL